MFLKIFQKSPIKEPDPTYMTHEKCQQNDIIGRKGIQHPTFGLSICNKNGCAFTICPKPCDPNIKPDAIAHGTHGTSQPRTVALSKTDLQGKERPQNAKFYEKRPEISEPKETFDPEATQQLHSNPEMLDNLRMYEKFFKK